MFKLAFSPFLIKVLGARAPTDAVYMNTYGGLSPLERNTNCINVTEIANKHANGKTKRERDREIAE